ncbi:Protein N-terminal glutamine amidohydrolase [Dendrobium catenatum]|uniref:Protein N-terminal glutamine amidohydrolase n=1 Tax=Dendrobium catenatum TaxID=906689 RepID=A0A2I0W0K3_9ASPA|nr:Protein N-terminal glutamine amidohydrolase [Dendrobium catenatum]
MAESSSVGDDHRAVVTAVPTLLSLAPSTSGWNSYPKFSSFTHTPCYCEENVYLLCKKLVMLGVAAPTVRDLFVVFISNDDKKIPLWNQKASKSSDKLVIWDYHVICIQIVNQKNAEEGRSSHLIWDLDSSLPFPLPLDQYVSETFRLHLPLKSTYKSRDKALEAPFIWFFFLFFSDTSTVSRLCLNEDVLSSLKLKFLQKLSLSHCFSITPYPDLACFKASIVNPGENIPFGHIPSGLFQQFRPI